MKLVVTQQVGEDSMPLVSKSPGVPGGVADYLGPVSVAVDVETAPSKYRPSANYHVYRPYKGIHHDDVFSSETVCTNAEAVHLAL